MTKQNSDDDDLRSAFRHLRERDTARASSFAQSWSQAMWRVQTAPRSARFGRYIFAGTLAAAFGALIMFAALHELRPTQRDVSAISVARWTAPSDVLLATSDHALWRGVPRLGDRDTLIPIDLIPIN